MKHVIFGLKSIVIGVGLSFAISYLLYDSMYVMIICPGIVVYVFIRQKKAEQIRARKNLTAQFISVIEIVSSGLKAGLSMENAWSAAVRESPVMQEQLCQIENSMKMNIPIESLLMEFATKSQVEEIQNFAEVFSYAKRTGGDLVRIIERTIALMKDKQTVMRELEVMIAAKKLEQRIMNIVPLFMLLYLRLSAPEYMSGLYHNQIGIGLMSGSLAAYIVAFILAERITNIRI